MANAYEVLGISSNASEEEIRRAHREQARRWHPDRFAEGPERMWAESKMIDINAAYDEVMRAMREGSVCQNIVPESEQFSDVRRLMELNQLSAARQALMRIATRTAEWNYLFGAVLFRLGEVEKSALYFGIAMRQRPGNAQYQAAYMSAQAMRAGTGRGRPRFSRILENVRRNAHAPRRQFQ